MQVDDVFELVENERRLNALKLKEAKRRERWPKSAAGVETTEEIEKFGDVLSSLSKELLSWGVGNGLHDSLTETSKSMLGQISSKIWRRHFSEALKLAQDIPRRWQVRENEFEHMVQSIEQSRFRSQRALFSFRPSAAITSTIGRWFEIEPHGATPADLMRQCLDKARKLPSWTPHAAAILYWLGHKAEHDVINQLPAAPDEPIFNADVVASLKSTAQREGRGLARALGYDSEYPIEIGVLETEKVVVEPNTGADFIIVAYLGLEDGDSIVSAAVVQGKMELEDTPFVTNIHRHAKGFGRNHQIRALTAENRDGYYLIYPRDVHSRPMAVVPGHTLLREVRRLNRGRSIEALTESKCNVRYDDSSVDLATFLGKVLIQPRNRHSSIGAALCAIGAPTAERGSAWVDVQDLLATRLVLIEIGGRVPQRGLDYLEALGFRRAPEQKASYEDIWNGLGD
ncbi:hypothetical protein [Rhizobium chutanense]|uniref:Uncharacterized protein n=1 Tax=Rhizobium chutanense TaxID=2035448 RepID=A0A2A6J6X6_9HYPH|nr:hypothetical protein [Rhizobium chutanense]PDT01604.1 hypothetical protein CO666_24215 [Rhizobium chutanense]RUM01206.1 hypothetical protein EFR84_23455 [Rhizobium chutanense]